MNSLKSFKQLLEEIVNSSSGGGLAGVNADPIPPVPPRRKPVRRKIKPGSFAGMSMFDVSDDEYTNVMVGRMPYERWARRLNMKKAGNAAIKTFAHRNPGVPIVVRNKKTGAMSFLRHGIKR